jgi:hypothetical protein
VVASVVLSVAAVAVVAGRVELPTERSVQRLAHLLVARSAATLAALLAAVPVAQSVAVPVAQSAGQRALVDELWVGDLAAVPQ